MVGDGGPTVILMIFLFYFVSRTSRRRDTHVFRWYLLAPHMGGANSGGPKMKEITNSIAPFLDALASLETTHVSQ